MSLCVLTFESNHMNLKNLLLPRKNYNLNILNSTVLFNAKNTFFLMILNYLWKGIPPFIIAKLLADQNLFFLKILLLNCQFSDGSHYTFIIQLQTHGINNLGVKKVTLKVVSTTFLLVCFVRLKESTCETRKNVFYFNSKTLFVLGIIKF